ncbi:replication-relaxation family protein [Actinoplanes sp. NPDC024001]|uniref:replication-relaxation family protein n=1 Tax=Actinoplanes sp. NPDC024001 TaxID=3154598 RepID=UPI0033E1E4DD
MASDPQQLRNIPAGDIPRPGVTARNDLLAASWRLQPRDYVIAHLLAEHRFLTTEQIAAILFRSPRTCRNRLDVLRRIGFIDWFMPVHPVHGRLPVHWVPGPLSARYVALYHGQKLPSSRAVRDERDAHPAAATRLGHLVHADGVNQFFIDLLTYARARPGARLARWWSARTTFAKVNHNTRPDGHGVWVDGDRQVAFFLEHDTGTETHAVRAGKLPGYRTLRDKGGLAWPVLFWLPTTRVEQHLHDYLAAQPGSTDAVIVATGARDYATGCGGPAGPVWHLVGYGPRRWRLAELPGPVGAGGQAYHPGPPAPEEDPLYLLGDAH